MGPGTGDWEREGVADSVEVVVEVDVFVLGRAVDVLGTVAEGGDFGGFEGIFYFCLALFGVDVEGFEEGTAGVGAEIFRGGVDARGGDVVVAEGRGVFEVFKEGGGQGGVGV